MSEKPRSGHFFRRLFLHILPALILSLVLIAGIIFGQYYSQYRAYSETMLKALKSAVTIEAKRLDYVKSIEDAFFTIPATCNEIYAKTTAFHFRSKEMITRTELDAIASTIKDCSIYYLNKNGHALLKSTNAPDLELSPGELDALMNNSVIPERANELYCAPFSKGYILIQRNYRPKDYYPMEYLPSSLNEKIVHIDADGKQIFGEESESDEPVILEPRLSESVLRAMADNCGAEDLVYDTDSKLFYYSAALADGTVIAAYLPVDSVYLQLARRALVPAALFVLFSLALLIYALIASSQHYTTTKDISKDARLRGGLRLDHKLLSHIAALMLFAILVTTLSSVYIHLLTFMSDFNINVNTDMQNIDVMSDSINYKHEKLASLGKSEAMQTASLIAYELSEQPNLNNESGLQKIKALSDKIQGIVIFDESGTITASDQGYSGHQITYNANEPETDCISLLNDEREFTISNAVDDCCYVGARLRKGMGYIRLHIKVDDSMIPMPILDMLDAISMTNIHSGRSYIYWSDVPDYLFSGYQDDTPFAMHDNSLSEAALQNGHFGLQYIDRHLVYTATRVVNDTTLICAADLPQYLFRVILIPILISLAGYVLIYFVLLLCTVLYHADKTKQVEEGEAEEIRRSDRKEQRIDDQFRKTISILLVFVGLLIFAMLLLDQLFYGKNSLIGFLFGRNWQKGFNLFSITLILLVFLCEMIVSTIVCKLIHMISKNMGPKGRTVGRMMASLVRFFLLIAAIFYSLVELGVDIKTLLTGAGLIGAAISLCAQSTVSDLFAGLFIVFEGSIHVGDWIQVDGERGEVYDIGIRTTTISKSGILTIISNSKMSNVTVLNEANSGPLIIVSVGYGEDIDRVINVIESNHELYKREIPKMIDGPKVLGVTDLGDSGVNIKIHAIALQENTGAVEVGMRRVTKKLFDMNNIEIPWPQVVVHNSEPVIHNTGKPAEQDNSEPQERRDGADRTAAGEQKTDGGVSRKDESASRAEEACAEETCSDGGNSVNGAAADNADEDTARNHMPESETEPGAESAKDPGKNGAETADK